MSRDWKSRGHTRLSLRLAGALAEPVSGGGSVASLHLEKALRAWPNAIRKCAAVSDLRRRLRAEGRRPVPGPRTARPLAGSAPAAPPHTPPAARCPAASPPASARPRHPVPALPAGASPGPLAPQALGTHRPGGGTFRRSRFPAPGRCQPVLRPGSPSPRAPALRGSPTRKSAPRARRAPHTSLRERPRAPRSAARGAPRSWRTPGPAEKPPPAPRPPALLGGHGPASSFPDLARSSRHPPCAADASGTCGPGGAGPARAAERRASGPVNTSCGIRPQDVPRRRPPARGAAVAAAAEQLNGAGTGAAPPLPPPPGAERGAGGDPAAEGARRHLHRPASARRARPPSARAGGRRGARGAREGPGPGRSERAGPRRRRDAAGTLLRPLPGSHSSPWAGRQAWCQEPGLPTPPPPPPAGALGRGGRGRASQPGAPRLSRSREGGCRRPPPPRASSRPSRARPAATPRALRSHRLVPAGLSCPRT
ncbi:translation initiation factor IF-2-like [Mustela putorius furo]|uniref:Translation initiation factor IF-2-like n=1 Tax=Mustela putorius furo TaxID=9669 RepID=A0A8U0RDE3_MUSPF|nr:translation initiation factor IF-2-like [Mustela putorius furo]